ncbi:substrate-binding periplasmic protein [Bdellovibrio sp. HCB209]|uniref:substrate-binding periplasmic protein n=1 Tax=Bdellovibrio sp. HCB209 TaxID=3394354 RepID=UPI0039B3F4F6
MKQLLSAMILMIGFRTSTAMADTIMIRSDAWCPYVCDSEKEPGYMVEVATKIFEKNGHKVNFSMVNWARAVSETRRNKATAILGANFNDAPDFVFPAKTLGHGQDFFFVKKESNWSYKGYASLAGKRIGVINGYAYGGDMDRIIKENQGTFISISGEHPLEQILKMMDSKRLDAFIENHIVMRTSLTNLGINPDDYKAVSGTVANDTKLYMAFSPTNKKSEEYAKIFSRGISEMRQNGELAKVLTKYNIPDWEQQETQESTK